MDLGKKIKHGHEDAPLEAPVFDVPAHVPQVGVDVPDFTPVPVRAPVRTGNR